MQTPLFILAGGFIVTSMSDTRTLNLTSLVSKKTRRAKARLLQNFGKADKTTDEIFEVYQLNFARQQSTALSLQKHVKNYLNCLKELHETSKALSQCLLDIHERDWPKHEIFENNAYELDHVNEDLEEKLKESVLVPLEQYIGQFTEIREKIAKRGRKLVDYDSQRHSYEALQQQGKQQDDLKLTRSRDQLEEARKVYEALNNELHEELPALYDNRLSFIITVFQRLFSSKITYHNDNLNIYKSYIETVEQLAKATEKGELSSATTNYHHNQILANKSAAKNPSIDTNPKSKLIIKPSDNNTSTSNSNDSNLNKSERFYPCNDQPSSGRELAGSVSEKPPVYLNKVRATYKYLAEDEDELTFEAGEIIQVIEYDDPSEQEDGWLMGIKESDGRRGLFPANFTKEI